MRKKFIATTLAWTLSMSVLFGCSNNNSDGNSETKETSTEKTTTENTTVSASAKNVTEAEGYDEEDSTRVLVVEQSKQETAEDDVAVIESTKENTIYLKEDSIETAVSGSVAEKNIVTISKPGVYILTGNLKDGQVVVDCEEKGTVELVLYNVDITNQTNAPVYIKNAKKVLLVLAENSENVLCDASDYTYEDVEKEEPSACLFSKDDLVISGNGSLTVNGNFKNGIASKDTLKITGGNLSVTAKNNAIKGKDCLMIAGGTFHILSEGDGLKADNTKDTTLGYIDISGGTFVIQAQQDGIQASSTIHITDGTFDIKTADGAGLVKVSGSTDFPGGWDRDSNISSETEETVSTKGIKSDAAMQISGGTFTIDSEDDAIHAGGTIEILGGTYTIKSGDDGIHGDDTITITDGKITIEQSYEGIESPEIIVHGGDIHVVSSDDGFNAAGGEVSSTQNKKPGMMMSASSGTMTIHDGYIYVNANGDGLDSNGDLTIYGGTVIVEGPTSDGDTAIDYDGTFEIHGGVLLAFGSAGMVEGVATSSTQNSVTAYLGSNVSAGTTIAITDENGALVTAFTPTKTSACIIYSSPLLETGKSYQVLTGGSCTGEGKDGLYTQGNYQDGTQIQSFTISSVVTTAGAGNSMGGNMGGQPGGNAGRPGENMGNNPRNDGNMKKENMPEAPAEGETPPELPEGMNNMENMPGVPEANIS